MRTRVFSVIVLLLLAACSGQSSTRPPATARPAVTAAVQSVGLEPADLTAASVTPLPSNTPAPPAAASPTAAPVCRANTGANLRAGPGTEFAKVGGVAGGQALLLVARNADGSWLQLDSGNWIKSDLVENCPDVPVASVIPPPAPAATNTLAPPPATFTPVPIQQIIPTQPPAPPAPPAQTCCKVCRTTKACGDGCIDKSYTCTKPPGCACNG